MADDIRLVLSVDDRDLLRARKEQEKYQYRIAQIEKEFRKGTITSSRYNKELAKQARELSKLGGGYNKANSEIRKYAYSLRNATDDQLNLAQAMTKSGKGMRRMEILAQQAGYQIGDFAVQVQSGTNVAVAFGQQMSQLLGFFGPYGAIAGAGIAIGTGLIAPLLNAKKAAKEAKEELSELDKSIKELRTGAAEAVGGDKRLEEARKPSQDLIYKIQVLEAEIEFFQSEYGVAKRNSIIARQKEVEELKGQLEIESQLFRVKVATIKRLEEAENKRKEAKEWEEGSEDRMLKLAKSRFDAGMALIEQKKKEREAAEEIEALSSAELKKLQDQNVLLQMQLQFGKDSAAYKQLETDIAVENYEADLLRKGVAEDTAKQLADQYRLSLNLKKELQEMSNITFNFAPTTAVAKAMEKYAGRGTVSTKDPIFGDSGKSIYTKPKTNKRDPLADLQKQLELEQALVGKTQARQRIIQALGVDYMKYGASTIKSLEDQINKTIELRKENERFAEEVEGPLTDAFGDVADAFGEFITNGLKDFKDFTKSIVASFKQMLAQMISATLRNRIFIPITTGISAGLGSSAAASAMGSYASGGGGGSSFLASIAGSLAGGASAFGSGIMAGIQGFAGGFAGGGGLMGGLSGYSATLSATAANAGIMGTIGAAVPAIAAVALVIGAFSSKTKELDSGLKATIKTNDVLIESYRKMQKTRFLGLSKKNYTTTDIVEGSALEQQILQLQHGIMSMAKVIGVADDVFNNFVYRFDISLKGLNEDQRLNKINEELGKMGNAFASLIPNVESLDQLNAIMNERSNLEIRLLQAQGNTAALREIELAGTNEYNRALLRQIFAAEDARDAIDEVTESLEENAFATKLQFERAKAYQRLGLDAPANTNSVPISTPTSPVMSIQRDPSIEELRREMKAMHEETMVAYSKLIKNTKDNKNILRGWDIVGLPAERSA